MIEIDMSNVKDKKEADIFYNIVSQLQSQAAIYEERKTIKKEFGDQVFIGEKMNLYVDFPNCKVRILRKPRVF
jgi:hypothetical protein